MWKGIVGRNFTPDEFETYVKGLHWGVWKPSFCVLHNTGVPTLAQWHEVDGHTRMQNLQHYYRDTQGWSAGPNAFISSDYIWVFTPLTTSGVHSPSWNEISLGIEMVGDYSKESFNPLVKSNTVKALAILHLALGLDSHTLRFHREDPRTSHKDCPGKSVIKQDMIDLIHAEMLSIKNGKL